MNEIENDAISLRLTDQINLIILLLFISLTPLLSAGYDHDITYWMMLLSLPLMMYGIIRSNHNFHIRTFEPTFMLILFIGWSVLSVFWSINQLRSIIEIIQHMSFAIVFFIMRSLSEPLQYKILRIGSITAVAIAAFGILEYIFVIGSRILATFPNPNPLGTYLAMSYLFLLGYCVRKPSRTLFISTAILLTAIILSGSRGTYLATIIATPIIYLGIDRAYLKSAFIYTIKLFITTTVTVAVIFFITPIIQERIALGTNLFANLARINSLPTSVTGRLEFWKVALKLVQDRPITGFGHGSYFAAYYIEYAGNEWYSRFAHNHYLQIAAELGVVGLALFLGFIAASARSVIKGFDKETPYYVGAVAACVMFLLHIGIEFSWNFPAVTIFFFALMGLITSRKPDELSGKSIKISNIVVIAALVFVFALTSWQFSSNKIFEAGLKASNNGDLEKGIELYELGNRIYPISNPGNKLASDNYFKLYQANKNPEYLDKAIALSNRAVELTPYSGSDHLFLAGLYVNAGNNEVAAQHYESAIRYSAYDLTSHVEYGVFNLKNSDIDKALEVFLKGSELIKPAIKTANTKELKEGVYKEAIFIEDIISQIYAHKLENDLAVNDGLVCPAIDDVNCPDSADETVHNKVLRKGELRQLSLNNSSDHMIINNPVSVA